jgi:uncharacterized OB-fold protein
MSVTIQKCTACASHFFPPRLLCAGCHGSAFEEILVDAGTVEAVTTLRHRAGIETDLNISLGLVRLEGGIKIVVRFDKAAPIGDVIRLSQLPDGSLRGEESPNATTGTR